MPQLMLARPIDRSLSAYKGWITAMGAGLMGADFVDDMSEDEWRAEWEAFWQDATPVAIAQAPVLHTATLTAPCWTATHEGKTYLVAPVVALVPGVLNGELVPTEEVAKFIAAWNDVPVPVNHPMQNGEPVSARSLDVLAQDVIGRFQNVQFDGRLRGELWLDIDKAAALGGVAVEVVTALQAGQPVEVSTAYFRDVEAASGVWGGVPYNGISRNIRPDHLALLPGALGACSWRDGCGAPRVHQSVITQEGGGMTLITIQTELSLDEQSRRVYEAFMSRYAPAGPLPEEAPDVWVREVFAKFVIAEGPEGLVQVPYTMNDTNEVEFGDPVRVEVVYQPVAPVEGEGVTPLTARRRIVQPKGGCSCMDKDTVTVHEAEAPPAAEPQVLQAPAPAALPSDLIALSALVSEIGGVESLRGMLAGLKANADAERARLVAELAANERCAFTAADLQAMPTEALTKLAQSLRPADYSGRGGPRIYEAGDEWETLAAPEVSRNGK